MSKYIVRVKEVHEVMVEVEAETIDEAIKIVENGEGTEIAVEYSHTLDSDTWYVEDDKGNLLR